jgi:hypothetical protein
MIRVGTGSTVLVCASKVSLFNRKLYWHDFPTCDFRFTSIGPAGSTHASLFVWLRA